MKNELNINQLHLNDTLTAADLERPEGATLVTDPDTVLVQCVEPKELEEVEGAEAEVGGIEPEVIGQKEEEAGED